MHQTHNQNCDCSQAERLKSLRKRFRVEGEGLRPQQPINLPNTQPPPSQEWQLEVGREEDELMESERLARLRTRMEALLGPTAQSQPQAQRLRTTTVRTEEYGMPGVNQPIQGGTSQFEANPPMNVATPQPQPYNPNVPQRGPAPPPAAQGAVPSGGDPSIGLGYGEEISNPQPPWQIQPSQQAGENPYAKIPAVPGQSGSSGVYRLSTTPALFKCIDCGVEIETEPGHTVTSHNNGKGTHNSIRKVR